jgi:hypothetical protein
MKYFRICRRTNCIFPKYLNTKVHCIHESENSLYVYKCPIQFSKQYEILVRQPVT